MLDDSGLIPPSPPPFDCIMPFIKITYNDAAYAVSRLDPQKTCVLGDVPCIIFKNCVSVLAPCLVKLFQNTLSITTSLLLQVCTYSLILFLKRVTALILQTTNL